VTSAQLLDGIQGKDSSALAGVDYQTLAEDYRVDASLVAESLAELVVNPLREKAGYEVTYDRERRPFFIRWWRDPSRVAEELEEIVERADRHPSKAIESVRASREVVGIELGASQLEDMGIVIAYEVARYIAQKCNGVILTNDGRWLCVEHGAFESLN
jgi:hypothetical protein